MDLNCVRMEDQSVVNRNVLVPELYFLISKFLANGPLRETAKVLAQELEHLNILPRRLDWTGQEHQQTLHELERKYPHVGPQHLVDLCSRIGPLLDRELAPAVPGVLSLLGAGRQSVLRTKESVTRPRALVDYYARIHHMPLADAIHRNNTHNIVKVLYGRESAGPLIRRQAVPTSFFSKQTLQRRTLGHLSAVYCVLFDRSGKYIITGADDLLVKLWSAIDGRLLATFRGASAEITDIAINLDNTMLAAGSLDRILRVWDLQYGGPIAVLSGHTGMITSVNFCPSPKADLRYLVTTSTDGSVAFWEYTTRGGKPNFNGKPVMYHEKLRPGQAQMICASFSPGGIFLAAGSADHHVRVYLMSEDGPKRILETESHSDTVDSIQWAHSGLRFISGSKDGTALLWHFETQQWKSIRLNMTERLPSCPQQTPEEMATKPKVTMVSWDNTDDWVITAVNDFTIKIWNAHTAKLHKVLRGHTNEIYVLESHQKDSGVLLSAGHDGQLFIWDIVQGVSLANFLNHIDGQGDGGIFDAKWSPDGNMIAATDSHGHILMFGYGSGHERLKQLPKELFFHTDYRPLIRDSSHHVMDEQTQTMPHLMPPPFLVDIDGNPYPPAMQRLVPGRENCPTDQLVPNIAFGGGGDGEVMQDGTAYSNIDRMIEALANRQAGPEGGEQAPDSNNDPNRNRNGENQPNDVNRQNGRPGVQRFSGNWHRDVAFKFHRRQYVRPMEHPNLQQLKQRIYAAGLQEHDKYRREMRRRPLMINTSNNSGASSGQANRRSGGARNNSSRTVRRSQPNGEANGRQPQPAYRTRAVRDNEPEPEAVPEQQESSSSESSNSDDSTAIEEELDLSGSSSSDTDSSDYSDWVSHEPGRNLEPPKRSKRKHVQRRAYSPPEIDQPGPSSNGRRPKVRKIPITRDGEIPEPFRPPEWLSEVIPRKAPYYPQMGDEVVYFRQGHARYLDAVRTKNVYNLGNKCEPWGSIDLRDHEYCKVIGIKYEIRPPRLCCLKLSILSPDSVPTGRSFVIKYHDMPDVLDFLVPKQTFATSVRRNWGPGDRFRCMIEDVWWLGQIESLNQLSPEFPNSLFMCFRVRWDNGEYEFMSPWDLEPVDENRLPVEVGGAVPVLPEELRATLYQPKPEEWPRGDRDASCRRIIAGLEQVMGLAIADLFLAPVDLNIYPEYAFVVEYPIDLNTIKARFENHFYRRITSAQFDVRYLATNAEKFNESHSNIVKHARIVTDLCLRILGDINDVDVPAVYHQLVDTYISSDSDSDSNRPGPSTSSSNNNSSNRRPPAGSRRSRRLVPEGDWRVDCRELLEMIWQCDDSQPFREPVDTLQHPDYLQIVDTPMDLRTIKEDLLGGNYESPLDFCKDMKLIFQNSRNYNTNKRSRIYSMTLRLSTLFEAHIKPIIYNWKSARRRGKANAAKRAGGSGTAGGAGGGAGGSGGSGAPKNRREDRSGRSGGGAGPSSRRSNQSHSTSGATTRSHHSDDDGDDDDDDEAGPPRRPTRNGTVTSRRVPAGGSNGVSSSSNAIVADPQPGPSRTRTVAATVAPVASSSRVTRRSQEAEDDEATISSSETESSSDSSDSTEDSTGVPVSHKRGYDSGEMYDPYKKKRRKKAKPKKAKKNSAKSAVSSSTPRKKPTGTSESRAEHFLPARQAQSQRPRNGTIAALEVPGPSRPNFRADNQVTSREERNNREQQQRESDKPKSSSGAASGSSRRITLRSARNNTETDSDDDDAGEGPSSGRKPLKRPQRYESDHSYHMARPKNARVISDSDNEEESPRSTRGTTRRAQAEWGRSEDSLEPPDHDEQPSNSQSSSRRMRPRNRISDPEHSPEETSNISKRGSSQRSAPAAAATAAVPTSSRARNWIASESDNDHHPQLQSPEQPSTSSSVPSRARMIRTNGPVRSPRKTESRTPPSNRRLRNISRSEPSVTPPPHTVDHNYGEPSSRTRTRNRQQLSRHQRNADELDHTPEEHSDDDMSDDDAPLRPRACTQISSRLRSKTNSPAKRKKPSATSDDEEQQEDSDEEFVGDPEEVDSEEEEATVESTDDDSDNVPLAATSKSSRSARPPVPTAGSSRSGTSRHPPAKSEGGGGISSRTRQKDRFSSDDDFGGPGPSSMRNTRKLKRPHYNEDSDDDDPTSRQRSKRPALFGAGGGSQQHHHNGNNDGGSHGDEDSDANSEDNEALTSVSSRGRVRRINPKMRKIFRE